MYHLVLEGRKVGPYDRRTIIGMRIKKTLMSDHVLIGTDGTRLTVGELIGQRPARPFSGDRSGSFSLVHATFTASVLEVAGRGLAIPRFKGEVEARVQADVLRISGRFRRGLGWKEDRVKIPLKDVAHVRVKGSQVDLWLRAPRTGEAMQRVVLELFSHEAAGDLAEWFASATPPASTMRAAPQRRADDKMLWAAGAGLGGAVAVILVLIVVAVARSAV